MSRFTPLLAFRHDRRVLPGAFYVGSLLLVLLALYFGSTEHTTRSDFVLTLALLLSLAGFGVLLAQKELTLRRAASLFVCYLPFAALWALSVASPLTNRHSTFYGDSQLMIYLGCVALILPTIILLAIIAKNLNPTRVLAGLRRHWAIVAVVIVFVLLSWETTTQWPSVDSFDYVRETQAALAWNLSLENADPFRLCGHQSFMLTPWLMIGGYLTPGDILGMHLIVIALLASSIVCFYVIVRTILELEEHRCTLAALLTCIYAFFPLVLGPAYQINVDVPLMVFLVWLAAAYVKGDKILFIFSAVSLVFCKEPGVVILAGFAAGLAVAMIVSGVRGKQASAQDASLSASGPLVYLIMSLAVCAAFILSYGAIPHWNTKTEPSASAMNVFGFSAESIVEKFKQFFLLDFSWILCLIILFAGFLWLLRKAAHKTGVTDNGSIPPESECAAGSLSETNATARLFPLLGAYLAVIAFNLVYITHLHPRYIVVHLPLFCLLAAFCLYYLFKRRKALLVSSTAALVLVLLIQNFVTYDPVSLRTFKNIDIGTSTIATTNKYAFTLENGLHYDQEVASRLDLVDAIAYNRQAGYMGTAFERMLAEIHYDSNTMVIIDPIYDNDNDTAVTYVALFGERTAGEQKFYYDPTSKRVLQIAGPEVFNSEVASRHIPIDLSRYAEFDRVFFISASWREGFEQFLPIEGLPTFGHGTSEYRGWEFEYYRIK